MELFTAQQIQSLNELELLVYRYINEHPNTVPFMRIRELAAEAHVSTTTVLHFCKKMGCDGYAQFKWKLKEQAGTNQETHLPDTLNELQNFLWRVGTPEYDAALDEAAGLIARAERVFLVGIGNSGSMAEYGARYLSNLGKFALSVTDPFYPVTVTPNVTMTAVLLSVSGETVQILHLAQQFKARGCSLIAVTASKHFKCNTFIAMWCCLALVNSDWGAIAARIASGETVKFLAFPMSQTTYTSTVLPPLFLVLVLSYLERWLNKHLPDIIKALAVPFICTVIMVPLTILVIGPVSDMLATGIANAYNFLVNTVPALAAILVGGIWQVFVIFGVHWGVTPMCLANFANYGCDSFQAFQTCAVIAQAAACFGVFLKTKKSDIKNVSLSAGLTGIFGITEPAIYGVTLRLKKPFVCGCVGGAIGALIISFFNTKYYVYAGLPGLLTTVNAMSDANPSSFTGMMIGVLATIIVTIILVQIVGCDEKEPKNN